MSEATVKREVTVDPAFSAARSPAQQNLAINFGSARCKALGILTGEAARSSHPVPEHSRAFRRLSQLGKSPELSAFIFLAISSYRLRSTTIAMAALPAIIIVVEVLAPGERHPGPRRVRPPPAEAGLQVAVLLQGGIPVGGHDRDSRVQVLL